MKRQKGIKLALINLLSNPDTIINTWVLDNLIERIPPEMHNFEGHPLHMDTGGRKLTIEFYQKPKDDSTEPKKPTGTAEGSKGSD